MTVLNQILLQAFYYLCAMLLMLLPIAFMMRGFFWKYVKVRMSLGRLILVKIRTVLRDYYAIGRIEEGFLIYKTKDGLIRISLNTTDKFLYRSIGVNWVDIDEEKNAISKCDYNAVTGFDSKKFSDLLTRALMRPSISSGQEKLILFGVLAILLLSLICAYFAYQNYSMNKELPAVIAELIKQGISSAGGTVVPSATI